MRVAVLTTVHAALDGRIFYKQATSLAQAGHEVTMYAPQHLMAAEAARMRGIAYVPLQPIRNRADRPRRWRQLMGLLHHNHFDVWHFHDPELLPLAVVWKWLFAPTVQLVYDVHEDYPKSILNKTWISPLLRSPVAKGFEAVERSCVSRVSLVVAATDAIGKRIQNANTRAHIVVVRNYPLRERFEYYRTTRAHEHHRPVRVIYCGALTAARGIREIALAMNYLRDTDVELCLLGEFSPASFGREILALAGPNVRYLGLFPFEDVPQHLVGSDIGIVCLRPEPAHLEALPIKLFEYMQAKLPVVASDFPLWRAIVEGAGCGLLVDPMKPEHIAATIRRLANDPDLRRTMGEAGARAVEEKYGWEFEAKDLLANYEMLDRKRYMQPRPSSAWPKEV